MRVFTAHGERNVAGKIGVKHGCEIVTTLRAH